MKQLDAMMNMRISMDKIYRKFFTRTSNLERISSAHPETPDETLLVSNSESGDFLSWHLGECKNLIRHELLEDHA